MKGRGGKVYLEKVENSRYRIEVNLHGGTLESVYDKKTGRELLWQGAHDSWKNKDVVIFPFVARLKDKTYTYKGESYSLDNHGLARYDDFTVLSRTRYSLTLCYRSSVDTLSRYPFEFTLYLTYELAADSLSVSMQIENRDAAPLYFGAGFHPAYKIDCTHGRDADDISGNSVVFDGVQSLTRYVLDESGSFIVREEPAVLKEIPLSKSLFEKEKTLIYGGATGKITLKLRSGNSIEYDMRGAPYLALWSYERRGGFVCVEPWWGLPDFAACDSDISLKKGINTLEGFKTFECGYKVKYNFGGESNDK